MGGTRSTRPKALTATAARKLGRYVYVYVDPFDGSVFYVGKGTGRRALAHLDARGTSKRAARIREIRRRGAEPRIEILVHGLESHEDALRIEAAAIDLLRLPELTNEVRGWGTRVFGRMELTRLASLLSRVQVNIREPSILVRINELYRPGMSAVELYDATRGVWRLGEKRERADFAFAVFEGVVQEVYEIAAWFSAGTTFSTRNPAGVRDAERCEFVGRVAGEPIRRRYLNRSVAHYFKQGNQSPVVYVNVE